MQELTFHDTDAVSGGIIPIIFGIVAADMGLISAMYGAGYWR